MVWEPNAQYRAHSKLSLEGRHRLPVHLPALKTELPADALRPIAQLSLHRRQPAELLDCTKAALARETSGIWEGLGSAVQCKKSG